MTGILKLVAAFGAGYTLCRFSEARFQGVPLDEAFKVGNLLKSVAYLKSVRHLQAAPVGGMVVVPKAPTRMPGSIADADYS